MVRQANIPRWKYEDSGGWMFSSGIASAGGNVINYYLPFEYAGGPSKWEGPIEQFPKPKDDPQNQTIRLNFALDEAPPAAPTAIVLIAATHGTPEQAALEEEVKSGAAKPEIARDWWQQHGHPELATTPHWDGSMWIFPPPEASGSPNAAPEQTEVASGDDKHAAPDEQKNRSPRDEKGVPPRDERNEFIGVDTQEQSKDVRSVPEQLSQAAVGPLTAEWLRLYRKKVKIGSFAEVGDKAQYFQQGKAQWADPILQVGRKTEGEHPVAGAVARVFNPKYVYRRAISIVVQRTLAVKKTIGDMRILRAVESGAMSMDEAADRFLGNFITRRGDLWAQTGGSRVETFREVRQIGEVTEQSVREALPAARRALSSAGNEQAGFAELGLVKGIAGAGVQGVLGIWSYRELEADIQNRDYARGVASGSAVAASITSIAAKGVGLLTEVSTVPLAASVGALSAEQAVAAVPEIVGAFAAGAGAGVAIEHYVPQYTAHAKDVGVRVQSGTGSTIAGGIATVVTVLPLFWSITKGYDYLEAYSRRAGGEDLLPYPRESGMRPQSATG